MIKNEVYWHTLRKPKIEVFDQDASFDCVVVGAAVAMRVEDYYQNGTKWWFRLHEKGGKRHEVPAHHNAATRTPTTPRLF